MSTQCLRNINAMSTQYLRNVYAISTQCLGAIKGDIKAMCSKIICTPNHWKIIYLEGDRRSVAHINFPQKRVNVTTQGETAVKEKAEETELNNIGKRRIDLEKKSSKRKITSISEKTLSLT